MLNIMEEKLKELLAKKIAIEEEIVKCLQESSVVAYKSGYIVNPAYIDEVKSYLNTLSEFQEFKNKKYLKIKSGPSNKISTNYDDTLFSIHSSDTNKKIFDIPTRLLVDYIDNFPSMYEDLYYTARRVDGGLEIVLKNAEGTFSKVASVMEVLSDDLLKVLKELDIDESTYYYSSFHSQVFNDLGVERLTLAHPELKELRDTFISGVREALEDVNNQLPCKGYTRNPKFTAEVEKYRESPESYPLAFKEIPYYREDPRVRLRFTKDAVLTDTDWVLVDPPLEGTSTHTSVVIPYEEMLRYFTENRVTSSSLGVKYNIKEVIREEPARSVNTKYKDCEITKGTITKVEDVYLLKEDVVNLLKSNGYLEEGDRIRESAYYDIIPNKPVTLTKENGIIYYGLVPLDNLDVLKEVGIPLESGECLIHTVLKYFDHPEINL